MGTTSPDALPYPDPLAVVPPLEDWFEDQALATQQALNRRPRPRHREFTTTRAAQPGNQYYYQVPTEDTSAATADTFGLTVHPDGSIEFLEAGIYSITAEGFWGIAVTGRARAERATAGGGPGGTPIIRDVTYAGEDRFKLSHPNKRIPLGAKYWLRTFKAATGSHTVTARLQVTKLRDL